MSQTPTPTPAADPHVPIRRLTSPQRYHWFGYYDKLQFDPSERYVLGMAVDFEGRPPEEGDVIELGMIDLEDSDRWIRIGQTAAWSWQQGCMLQWRPGSDRQVIWNDREGEGDDARFVSRLLDVFTGQMRTLAGPIYTLSPDGTFALGCDFARIDQLRPGYGYAGLTREDRDQPMPASTRIFRIDLGSGERIDLFGIQEAAAIAHPREDFSQDLHWFNHLLLSPEGDRFVLLHRWRYTDPDRNGYGTRMISASPHGGIDQARVFHDLDDLSHFIWRDGRTILAWANHVKDHDHGKAFYLHDDPTGQAQATGVGNIPNNGHCTFLPGTEWLLSDDVHKRSGRFTDLFVYHMAREEARWLGAFHASPEYDGQFRCDLHPRQSPTGRWITIDSVHEGMGRQMYLLDIGAAWE